MRVIVLTIAILAALLFTSSMDVHAKKFAPTTSLLGQCTRSCQGIQTKKAFVQCLISCKDSLITGDLKKKIVKKAKKVKKAIETAVVEPKADSFYHYGSSSSSPYYPPSSSPYYPSSSTSYYTRPSGFFNRVMGDLRYFFGGRSAYYPSSSSYRPNPSSSSSYRPNPSSSSSFFADTQYFGRRSSSSYRPHPSSSSSYRPHPSSSSSFFADAERFGRRSSSSSYRPHPSSSSSYRPNPSSSSYYRPRLSFMRNNALPYVPRVRRVNKDRKMKKFFLKKRQEEALSEQFQG